MVALFLCDGGCGKTIENISEMKVIGLVRPGHYCEKCAKSVEKFESDRDALHSRISEYWNDGLKLLKEDWVKKHPRGTLPDG